MSCKNFHFEDVCSAPSRYLIRSTPAPAKEDSLEIVVKRISVYILETLLNTPVILSALKSARNKYCHLLFNPLVHFQSSSSHLWKLTRFTLAQIQSMMKKTMVFTKRLHVLGILDETPSRMKIKMGDFNVQTG